MKITLTIAEAAPFIAESINRNSFQGAFPYNVSAEDITISAPSASVTSYVGTPLTDQQKEEHIGTIIDAAIAYGRKGPVVNRIGMIKAIRALTGCGLKEAKDLSEKFCPFN